MKSPWIYAKNLIQNAFRTIRYGGRYHAGLIQSYEQLHVEVMNGGTMTLGNYGQSRGSTYLVAAGGRLNIGQHVNWGINCYVASMAEITIGDYCRIAPGCIIVDHDHDFRGDMEHDFVKAPISIGEHTWVCSNCTIVKGTRIGSHCVIGAGSVVSGDVPDGTIYVQKRDTQILPIKRREV